MTGLDDDDEPRYQSPEPRYEEPSAEQRELYDMRKGENIPRYAEPSPEQRGLYDRLQPDSALFQAATDDSLYEFADLANALADTVNASTTDPAYATVQEPALDLRPYETPVPHNPVYYETDGGEVAALHGEISRDEAVRRIINMKLAVPVATADEGLRMVAENRALEPLEGSYLVRTKGTHSWVVTNYQDRGFRHHKIDRDHLTGFFTVSKEPFGPQNGIGGVLEALAAREALVPRPANFITLRHICKKEQPAPPMIDEYFSVADDLDDNDEFDI